jgi:Uma2 family endonuclease
MAATYDDLVRLKLPEWLFAEIIDGELRVQRLPPPRGTVAVSAIGAFIGANTRRDWCVVLRVEVNLGGDVLVPDVVGWRRTTLPRIPNTQGIDVAPDWVCEVITRETFFVDRTIKPKVYARNGVPYLWLVDPETRTFEVNELIEGEYECVGRYQDVGELRAAPFETSQSISPWCGAIASQAFGTNYVYVVRPACVAPLRSLAPGFSRGNEGLFG